MIVKIEKNAQFQEGGFLFIDKSVKNKINNYWEDFIKERDGYFNGDVYVVGKKHETDEKLIFDVSKAKYADLVYAQSHSEIKIFSLFASILWETKDHFFVFIRNHHDRINVIGGLASSDDFVGNIFCPEKCLKREVKEEIGFDLDNQNQILDYEMKYLAIPDEGVNASPFGTVFQGTLNFTKEELIAYFNQNQKQFDQEIQELLFFKKNDYSYLISYHNKEPYLVDLMNVINL